MQRYIWTFLVVWALTPSAGAVPQGKGRGGEKKGQPQAETGRSNSPASPNSNKGGVFGRDEEKTIRDWFSVKSNLQGLPPGLAKRDQLPPGLQKQLVRNGALPPGLQKQVQPLPQQLEGRLPRLPEGRRRVAIGGNVIVLEERTGAILDVLQSVF
jgi:hypothetical protein